MSSEIVERQEDGQYKKKSHLSQDIGRIIYE